MRILAVTVFAAALAATGSAAGAAQFRASDVVFGQGGLHAQTGKPNPGASVPVTPAGGGVLAPLTAQECRTLGGSVITASFCNSGSSCQRTDQSGTVHEVCLSQ